MSEKQVLKPYDELLLTHVGEGKWTAVLKSKAGGKHFEIPPTSFDDTVAKIKRSYQVD